MPLQGVTERRIPTAASRTLTWRFTMLYASVMAILIGVCATVLVHLERIRTDSERVMEESREYALTTKSLADIANLRLMAERAGRDVGQDPALVEILFQVRDELSAEEQEDLADPSREEHQSAEDRIIDRLRRELASAGQLLEVGRPVDPTELLERLDRAAHFAGVLRSETREETLEAGRDLEHRTDVTRVVMIGVLLSAVCLLGIALGLVHLAVVRPIRRLRDGADRFGSGELDHRIRLENHDEIGDLALSFNAMANRLASAQSDLEDRVRERTQQFLRAARLADLGILASGIAHEINTPLASISSCAEGMQRRIDGEGLSGELLEDYTRTMAREAFRARDITKRMLALVRQEPGTLADVPLQLVLEQSVHALRHRAEGRGVHIECDAPPEPVLLEVNAGELVQILVNLLANAIDASALGGAVHLRARSVHERVEIEVEDAGSGIDPVDLERIFDPFFTTKRPGEGTGLGLPLVHALVESHAGHVAVKSEPGRGTLFSVNLPRSWERDA